MTNNDEGTVIAKGRNFLIDDATYRKLKVLAAEKSTTVGGAISFLINNYTKDDVLPVKTFGGKPGRPKKIA